MHSLARKTLRSVALASVIAAGVYATQRVQHLQSGRHPVIDWQRVQRIATNTAVRGHHAADEPLAVRQAEFLKGIESVEPLIARYTKTVLPQPLRQVYAFDRSQWIEANVATFQVMFAPVESMYRSVLGRLSQSQIGPLFSLANSAMLTWQLGMLLGYLSRRVLGQYDMSLLGREPVVAGRLYFVEENIASSERLLKVPPEQFRQWICLHEATHAFEFEGHSWLSGYVNSCVTNHMQTVSDEIATIGTTFTPEMFSSLAHRFLNRAQDGSHWMEYLMSDPQRESFRQLQALMCLLEGFSNHVMDHIGLELMADYHTIKERFDARRKHPSRLDQVWAKITGLEMKMEQYALGESFVNRVVALGGIEAINLAFESPANLPTLPEIHDPERWMARMQRSAVRSIPN